MPENANRRAHLHAHLAAGTRPHCRTCVERATGLPSCAACGRPMIAYEPNQATHPGCDEAVCGVCRWSLSECDSCGHPDCPLYRPGGRLAPEPGSRPVVGSPT